MTTQARTWIVTTHDGTVHPFETEDKAVAFAMLMCWADRATTITTPEDGAYVVLRRHPKVIIQVVHVL